MAGKPLSKERREREEADRGEGVPNGVADRSKGVPKRASRVPESERRRAVERAAAIGTGPAAIEFGVSAPTIRSWRSKLKAEGVDVSELSGEAGGPVAETVVPTSAEPSEPGAVTSVAELTSFARDLLATARNAQQGIDRALREGRATQGYHAALASGIAIDKVGSLTAAIERLQEREQGITEAQGQEVRAWLLAFGEALGIGTVLASTDGLRMLQETRYGAASRDLAVRVRDAAWSELDRARRRRLPVPEDDVLDAEPVADDGEEDGPAGDVEIAEGEVVEDAPVDDAEVVGDSEPVQPSERPSPAEESLERLARRDGSSMQAPRRVSRGPRESGYGRFGRAG